MLFDHTHNNSPQTMLDKFNVRELIEFERFCRDNALWAEMKTCYAADSLVTVSWFKGTGAEFVAASSQTRHYAPHKLYQTLIWTNHDKALAITMATIQIRNDFDGLPVELQSDLKIIYRVQKINGIWVIVSLGCIYEKDALIPVYPGNHLAIPIDEISKYRSSYANLCFILNRSGYKIDDTLAGIDKPETVQKIYQEANAWLSQ